MEIKNQVVQCPQGHYYNASIHASCPICSGAAADGSILPTGAPSAVDMGGSFVKTEAPSSAGGAGAQEDSFVRTEAPSSAGGADMSPGSFARTEAPSSPGGSAGNGSVSPFEPTMIGDLSGDNAVEPVVGWLACVDGGAVGGSDHIQTGSYRWRRGACPDRRCFTDVDRYDSF